jgi:hypothetical protein
MNADFMMADKGEFEEVLSVLSCPNLRSFEVELPFYLSRDGPSSKPSRFNTPPSYVTQTRRSNPWITRPPCLPPPNRFSVEVILYAWGRRFFRSQPPLIIPSSVTGNAHHDLDRTGYPTRGVGRCGLPSSTCGVCWTEGLAEQGSWESSE